MASQKTVFDFCTKHNIDCNVESRLLDLVSEIGELSKEILKTSDYGRNPSIVSNDDILLEFGDVLFSLTCLANKLNIEMDHALALVLQKYEKRFAERATISSS